MVQYRRALAADYPEILRMNEANFLGNLTGEERADGFLSAVFSAKQIAAMAEDLGIIIAVVEETAAGFLCGFRNEFDQGSKTRAGRAI